MSVVFLFAPLVDRAGVPGVGVSEATPAPKPSAMPGKEGSEASGLEELDLRLRLCLQQQHKAMELWEGGKQLNI